MAGKSVTFLINLGGDAISQTKKLTVEVNELGESTKKAQSIMSKWSQLSLGIDSIMSIYNRCTGALKEFTDANMEQQEAETKLAQTMHNTMNATSGQIQKIKELTARQQELGVVGDEVQLAGAQELSTYLSKTASLEKLIPVMNDMVAQQYGYNATQESSVNIATMLGKVMDGQVGALSRYGYKFDEAQAKILKFGTEEQRVAVLSDVVSSAVGGVNAKLAQTPVGAMKQTSNRIGDIKEQVGNLIVDLEFQLLPDIKKILAASENLIIHLKSGVKFIIDNMPLVLGAAGAGGILYQTYKINTSLNAMKVSLGITSGGWIGMAAIAKAACKSIGTAIMNIPIVGWIAAGITLVIAVVKQLWDKCQGFREFVMGIWEILKGVFSFLGSLFSAIWNKIKAIINGAKTLFTTVISKIKQFFKPITDFFSGLWDTIKNIFSKIIGFMGRIFNPIIQLWNKLTGKVVSTYQTGATKGRASFQADQKSKTKIDPASLPGFTDTGTDIAANAPASVKQSAESAVTGGTRNTQITIHLGKMTENVVFNGTLGEKKEELMAQFKEMMLQAIYAAGNANV